MTRSEHRSRWNLGSSRAAMTLALGLMMQAAPAYASPAGGDVVAGQASISGEASGNVTVTQTTDRAVINWDSFSVAKDETVVFRQPGAQSVTANRVIGADPSSILGSIQANGRVILINRNGVVFGKDSTVDAAGLVVSTHDLDQLAFMAGNSNIRFNDGGVDTAEIVVNGRISIRDAGLAAFVAPHVRNDGLIEAKLGRVALGAGRGFSVDLFGDGLISFAAGDEVTRSIYGADGNAVNALVENSGTIIANGGQILLTASAARDVINASVSLAGVVRADSASNRNGIITLSGPGAVLTDTNSLISASGAQGGNINVQGSAVALGGIVDASSSGRRSTGGSVNVQAQGLLSLGGTVKANATQGAGGSVVYRAGRVMENSSGVTDVRGLSDGGTISAIAANNYATSGTYLADGLFGKGGRIDVTGGGTVSLLSAKLFASGRNMGGLVRAGGPFQGGKAFDGTAAIYDTFVGRWNDAPALPHAASLFVNDSTRIDVSASRGAGGTAILWSDKTTTFLGAIDARGWTPGSVEVSSADNLRYVSLENINTGPGGTILLDPKNIIIGTTNDVSAWSYAGVLNLVGGVTAQPNGVALENNDFFGTSVSLNAAGDRLAVGAYFDDGFGNTANNSGAVYLFSFSDTRFSGGALAATIGRGYTGGNNLNLGTALEADDQFGISVSLNAAGDRLAVGADRDDGFGNVTSNSGSVRLFTFANTSFDGGALAATIGRGYTGGSNLDLGTDLETLDNFGQSVSLNAAGDRLAVGAFSDDGAGNAFTQSGSVRLFTFTNTSFGGGALAATIGRGYTGGSNLDLGTSLEAADNFGQSVSLNAGGDRLAVGALDAGFGNVAGSSGSVRLFTFGDTSFGGGALAATIGRGYTGGNNLDLGTGLAASDFFGHSVSLNAAGDRLAVGVRGDDGFGNMFTNSGSVQLFTFTNTSFGGGALAATIGQGYTGGNNLDLSADLESLDQFGWSVSLNAAGDRLAVGAPADDGFDNAFFNSGSVRLFTFTNTSFGGGALQGTIGRGYTVGENVNLTALQADDYFGQSVSLNAAGDRLVVSAPYDGGFGNAVGRSGAVYLFSFSDTRFSGGALEATIGRGYTGGKNVNLTALEVADLFGFSVSLNAAGDRLAVGAQDDGFGNAAQGSGAVYLFSFSDTRFSDGALEATIGSGYTGGKNVNLPALEQGRQFGSSVSLNAAGDRLAVGAIVSFGIGVLDPGAVYLFSFSDTRFSGGALEATIGSGYTGGKNVNLTALEADDFFGTSVSLNAAGDRLAVGAAGDSGVGDATIFLGAVYLFGFSDMRFSGGVLQATIGSGYTGGKNIDLTALEADDAFGSSVSLNAAGDQLAVGAIGDGGFGNAVAYSGAVYLFSFSDTRFSGGALEATIGAGYTGGKNVNLTQLEPFDYFGTSVSLNAAGDRLAVGVSFDDGAGNAVSDSGAVYLFSFSDMRFSGGALEATIGRGYTGGKNLNLTSLDAYDIFGISVALNAAGDRLAVGANGDDGSGNIVSGSGAVYLFSFSDTRFNGGALEATVGRGYTGGKNVNVTALEANDVFGRSVSLNAAGDRLAVGANRDDGFGNTMFDSGAVYLFSFSDTRFSDGTLEATIGAGYMGGKNVNLAALEASDYFGTSVSLNAAGDRLAVGALSDDGLSNAAISSGAVYLFSFSDTRFSGGALEATLGVGYTGGKNVSLTALEAYDSFGQSVSLSAAGDRLAAGALSDDGFDNAATNTGAVYLFSFSDTRFSSGALEATIGAGYLDGKNVNLATLESGDSFGQSVALNAAGDRLAVGANLDDGLGNAATDSGAVYLLNFRDSSFSGGTLQSTIGHSYTGGKNVDLAALEANDQFGQSVSLNAVGDQLAVGASLDDGLGNSKTDSGAVYLFVGSVSASNNFADDQSGNVTISAASLAASLRSGSNVLLQASNDITVYNPILVTAGAGSVGTLNLSAGRSIHIYADITTQGGNVVLIGNSTAASGVVDAQRDPGAAVITMAPGAAPRIDAGTGTISVLLDTGAGLTNNTSGDISLHNLTGSTITVRNAGPSDGSGIILNFGAQLIASGNGNAIALIGQKFVNYGALSAVNGFWRIWSSNPDNDNVGGLAFDYKQYGLGYSELATPAGIGNGLIYSFAPTLTATLGASSKIYDTDRIAAPASLAFSGVLSGDTLTLPTWSSALYDTKDAGTNKTVTATGLGATITSGGKPVYGYVLPSFVSNTNSVITPASLVIAGVTAQNKVYDTTLSAALTGGSVTGLGSDAVSLVTTNATGSFANKNVGNAKAVTATGYGLSGADALNYTLVQPTGLTANITPASLVIAGVTAQNKVYDTTLSASLTGGSVTGLGSDAVSLVTSGVTGSFADKNVGNAKAVTATGYALSGADALNYTLVQPTGLTANITPANTAALISVNITPANPTAPLGLNITSATQSAALAGGSAIELGCAAGLGCVTVSTGTTAIGEATSSTETNNEGDGKAVSAGGQPAKPKR